MKGAQTSDRRWAGLVFLTLGASMVIVDSTVINVAIPTIMNDLGITYTTAQWTNSIYSLVFASLLIQFGRLADRVGRVRLFNSGLLVFVLASIAASLAPEGASLVLARLVQGIGGAMIMPSALSTLNAMFTGSDRAKAFGVWGAMIGGIVALGPIVGGWLTTTASWRLAFLINVPLALICYRGVRKNIAETRDENFVVVKDPLGAISVSGALGAAIFATIEGNTFGWWHQRATFSVGFVSWPENFISVVPVAYVIAVAAAIVFATSQAHRRSRKQPMLYQLSLYRLPSFRNGNFAAMVVSLGELGTVFVLPLYLGGVLAYSALDIGLLLVFLSLGAFFAGGIAPRMSNNMDVKNVVVVGFALEILGIVPLGLLIDNDTAWFVLAPFLFLYGCGVGLATAQLTSVVLRDVPVASSGQASGLQSTVRQLGAAMGIALLGSVYGFTLYSHAEKNLSNVTGLSSSQQKRIVLSAVKTGGVKPDYESIKLDGQGARRLRRQADHAVESAVISASKSTSYGAAIFIALGMVAATRIPAVNAKPHDLRKA